MLLEELEKEYNIICAKELYEAFIYFRSGNKAILKLVDNDNNKIAKHHYIKQDLGHKFLYNCENYAIKLKDSSDYSMVFDTRNTKVPRDILGRGLSYTNGVHEFQTACITTEDINESENIINIGNELRKKYQITRIKVLK